MRRTSARFRLGSAVAVMTAVVTLGGLTATSGVAAEPVETVAVGTPTGFGRATTGGAGGSVVTVTSASAFASAAASSSTQEIRVSGTINLSSMTRVTSNKTIIGVGSNARITGYGLNIRQANNVIIQNITFSGSADDGINIEYSTNVWVDHNNFTGHNDGALDIKRASDNITVSWNRFYGQDKNSLLGHSDDNSSEDSGRLRVTYHHNWYDGTNQRNPRVRFGNPVHVYNNYYSNIGSYGVASTTNAGVLVEGNFFENTDDPFHRGEGSSPDGALVARNNHFVNSGTGETGGSVAGIPYSYSVDTPSGVKSSVTSGAGVGRI